MNFIPEVNMDFVPTIQDEEIDDLTSEEEPDDRLEPPEGITDVEEHAEAEIMYDESDKIIPLKIAEADLTMGDIFQGEDPPVRLTKKGKPFKKRPPLSEEHKEKLKSARVKAMAVRQKKAADKKETLEIEKQEKELLKKQRVKKLKKLKEEVEEGEPVAPPEKIIKKESSGVDVERAVLEGITKYELIRKQRKKEKREQEARDKEEDMVRETLRRAVAPKPKAYNPYEFCY